MLIPELRKDPLIERWLNAKNATEDTAKSYLQSMHHFTDFTGMSPTELIEEAEAEIRAGLLMREKKIERYIIDFRMDQEKKISPVSVKTRLAAVMSFYGYYNVPLPVLPKSMRKATPKIATMELPTKDEIRELLSHASVMEKAFILVGVASGLSASDIAGLKIEDFERGYDAETEVTTLHLIRQKTGVRFFTFLTPEATRVVKEYLKWRNDFGEKTKVVSKKGFLFVKKYIPDKYLATKNENLRKLNRRAIIKRYQDVNHEAGNSSEFKEYNKLRSHSMRKYFNDTLVQVGKLSPYQVDLWMGHDLGEAKGSYIVPAQKEQREIYIQYMHLLTIDQTLDPTEHPVFIEMKKDKDAYKRVADQATVDRAAERNELADLRAEIERIKKENEEKQKLNEKVPELVSLIMNSEEGKKIFFELQKELQK